MPSIKHHSFYQLRLYSRDQELSHAKCLDTQALPHAVVTMTLQGSILLVLTSDNTLYHYSVTTTRDTIRLVIGDSMSLQGLNPSASKVRALCGFSAGRESQRFGRDEVMVAYHHGTGVRRRPWLRSVDFDHRTPVWDPAGSIRTEKGT